MNTPRKFGVEIEALGMNPTRAANVLADAGIDVRNHAHTHNGPQLETAWKTVFDGSVYSGFEAVSPPLRDFDSVKRVCVALRSAGAHVNRSTGLHVHVDAGDLDLDAWKRLAKLWLTIEDKVETVLSRSRRGRSQWCRSNTGITAYRDVQEQLDAIDSATTVRGVRNAVQSTRYVKFNMDAYWVHGTVEFRCHQGTLNETKIENWARLVIRMVDVAKLGKSPKKTLDTLSDVLDYLLEGIGETVVRTRELRARPGTKNDFLYGLFNRARVEGWSKSRTYYEAECAGVLRHTARRAYSVWKRAQRNSGQVIVTGGNADSMKSYFMNRATQVG